MLAAIKYPFLQNNGLWISLTKVIEFTYILKSSSEKTGATFDSGKFDDIIFDDRTVILKE